MKTPVASFTVLLMVANLYASPFLLSQSFLETPLKSNGEGPRFFLDYTNTQGKNNQTLVEFYIDVEYGELQFIRHEDGFQANYNLNLFIFDEENNLVSNYAAEDRVEVDTYVETKSTEKARFFHVPFSLDAGKYHFKVLVTDRETEKTSRIKSFFIAPNFQSQNLMVSDVQLSQKIEPAQPGQSCVKNNLYIEPNILRSFTKGLSDIHIYFEVYNLAYVNSKPYSTYTTSFVVRNSEGDTIAQSQSQNTKLGTSCANIAKIAVANFNPGKYILTVRVRDDATGKTAQAAKSFVVIDMNSPISLIGLVPNEEL